MISLFSETGPPETGNFRKETFGRKVCLMLADNKIGETAVTLSNIFWKKDTSGCIVGDCESHINLLIDQ